MERLQLERAVKSLTLMRRETRLWVLMSFNQRYWVLLVPGTFLPGTEIFLWLNVICFSSRNLLALHWELQLLLWSLIFYSPVLPSNGSPRFLYQHDVQLDQQKSSVKYQVIVSSCHRTPSSSSTVNKSNCLRTTNGKISGRCHSCRCFIQPITEVLKLSECCRYFSGGRKATLERDLVCSSCSGISDS